MRALLVAGADINAPGRGGFPAIYWATSLLTKDEPLRLLIQHGAEVDAPEHMEDAPILRAACTGELSKVRMLLDAGASPDTRISGQPLLCWVAEAGDLEVAELLIQHGAKVDARNRIGSQAVHLAARGGSREMLHLLQQAGADLMDRNSDGDWPLLLAVTSGHIKAAEFLLEAGSPIPESMQADAYWTRLLEHAIDREVASLVAVRRLVHSALLSRSLESAMASEALTPPSRASGPSPL